MYRITNLISTRQDPNKRRAAVLGRRAVVVGTRQLRSGESITISDAIHDRCIRSLDDYAQAGVLTVQRISVDIMGNNEEPGPAAVVAAVITVVDTVCVDLDLVRVEETITLATEPPTLEAAETQLEQASPAQPEPIPEAPDTAAIVEAWMAKPAAPTPRSFVAAPPVDILDALPPAKRRGK